jgi:hypothetical protein
MMDDQTLALHFRNWDVDALAQELLDEEQLAQYNSDKVDNTSIATWWDTIERLACLRLFPVHEVAERWQHLLAFDEDGVAYVPIQTIDQ